MFALLKKIFFTEPRLQRQLMVNRKEIVLRPAKISCLIPSRLDENSASKTAPAEARWPESVLPREALARGYLWGLRIEA